MRASSNNHYQKSLPFTGIQIHSNKFSEDDTGYDSLPKQERINSTAGLSSSSALVVCSALTTAINNGINIGKVLHFHSTSLFFKSCFFAESFS